MTFPILLYVACQFDQAVVQVMLTNSTIKIPRVLKHFIWLYLSTHNGENVTKLTKKYSLSTNST